MSGSIVPLGIFIKIFPLKICSDEYVKTDFVGKSVELKPLFP